VLEAGAVPLVLMRSSLYAFSPWARL